LLFMIYALGYSKQALFALQKKLAQKTQSSFTQLLSLDSDQFFSKNLQLY
jgi:hypothetical protein